MFLLRRKADGKYFRNKGFRQDTSWRTGNKGPNDPRWVDNPSECKPFISKSGARNSRGVAIGMPHKRPVETSQNRAEWDEYFQKQRDWYSPRNLPARTKIFNEKYEIVEVTIKVQI